MKPLIEPKIGQLLYRGCSCDEFARIIAIGKKDFNGMLNVMDIELIDGDINELMEAECLCDYVDEECLAINDDNGCVAHQSPAIVVLPPNTKIIVKDVPYKAESSISIRLWINNVDTCSRCMSRFYPHDEDKGIDWND